MHFVILSFTVAGLSTALISASTFTSSNRIINYYMDVTPFQLTQMVAQLQVQPINRPQSLPITAQAKIGTGLIELEVARTPQQQALGLMFRTALPDNRGMLFPFAQPRVANFWMKNCKIPLDMLFLRNGRVEAITKNAPPCNTAFCPSYSSGVPVDQVIELRGGRAEELGVKVGDRILIQPRSS